MARYDGVADWYDERIGVQPGTAEIARGLIALLGPGPGGLVDIGCGTGLFFPNLVETGWRVTGVDISADQLRVARERAVPLGVELLEADVTALPFETSSFDAACVLRVLTDVDDPGAVLAEAARVVRDGGPILVVSAHPCFVGPYVRVASDGSREVLPGYRQSGWHFGGPGIGDGIRSRVGVRHITLAELLNAVAAAGLRVEAAEEPGEAAIPTLLMLRLRSIDRAVRPAPCIAHR